MGGTHVYPYTHAIMPHGSETRAFFFLDGPHHLTLTAACQITAGQHERCASVCSLYSGPVLRSVSLCLLLALQASLNKLMETLGQSEPYFVKCIRSNAEKVQRARSRPL